jgi:hypothetical protein
MPLRVLVSRGCIHTYIDTYVDDSLIYHRAPGLTRLQPGPRMLRLVLFGAMLLERSTRHRDVLPPGTTASAPDNEWISAITYRSY